MIRILNNLIFWLLLTVGSAIGSLWQWAMDLFDFGLDIDFDEDYLL